MRTVAVATDQLARRQPGGIGTYVRGLLRGLAGIEGLSVYPVGPRPGPAARLRVGLVTAAWASGSWGVPRAADVVHAPSLAGPMGGGRAGAVHSVAVHDLLWRDVAPASTARGRRFHEARLRRLVAREDVRIVTTSPLLGDRLIAEGVAADRLIPVRLGADEETAPASSTQVRAYLAERGVAGPFTLAVGTREPRKNLERLVRAHAAALGALDQVGPLVLVGPAGWGAVDTGDARVLGELPRSLVLGLLAEATVVAYVPLDEGWGLPPIEALRAGAPVVASATTPSVAGNPEVVLVDPLDVDAIAAGLVAAATCGSVGREARQASVADLTWHQCALDHLAGW